MGWPRSERSEQCLSCSGSTVLLCGPREGALWCWVRGASVSPIDRCSSYQACQRPDEKASEYEAGALGVAIRDALRSASA